MRKVILFAFVGLFIVSCSDKLTSLDGSSPATTRSVDDGEKEQEPDSIVLSEKPEIFPYKVKKGSEEWKKMSWAEREDACQLPEEFIGDATSYELAMACIEHPMAFAYVFYMDPTPFISSLIEKNNGFAALFKKNDGYMELAKIYEGLELIEYASEYMYNQSSVLIYPFIELVLSHENVISKFNPEELKWLKSVTYNKYAEKLAKPDDFGILNIESSIMLWATIILRDGTPLTEKEAGLLNLLFDNTGSGIYVEDFESIIRLLTEKTI